MSNSIDLEQFIKKSKQRQNDRMKLSKVFIKGYDAEFTLMSLGFAKVTEMMDGVDSSSVLANMAFNKELIYESMPILKSKDLQAQYNCAEPFDIVFEVFNLDEIQMITEQIMAFNGMDIGVDEVKN